MGKGFNADGQGLQCGWAGTVLWVGIGCNTKMSQFRPISRNFGPSLGPSFGQTHALIESLCKKLEMVVAGISFYNGMQIWLLTDHFVFNFIVFV